ncbi:MAG: UDP-N-acetylglucosamine 2-epimerase (non-hydrolyzing) [Bacteroidetes bacterium]|nr:UDP-N-acetylglucosamine 2-epimerase (non-hydrolyzing) [Bacteroidota bacterium]
MSTVISVVGARPNFMKAAPVKHAFERIPSVRHLLVHTGQHYDPNMSDVFFEDLGMGRPDLYLNVGSGSHAVQTAKVMVEFERICLEERPAMVIVYGDVNSTLAAGVVAKKLNVPLAHVESGLRSYDRRMPEEINRIATDAITDLFFVTEESGRRNLMHEGIRAQDIHLVGNTMIDSLARFCASHAAPRPDGDYFVLTLHRPSNVDDPAALRRLLDAIDEGAGGMGIRFPVHPRTEAAMRASGDYDRIASNSRWRLLPPAGYSEFIQMVRAARGVITDSGGVQEETTWLGIPCLTLRESTERPSTVEVGTNHLIGVEPLMVRDAVARIAASAPAGTEQERHSVPPLWDGDAASRIARAVVRYLEQHTHS